MAVIDRLVLRLAVPSCWRRTAHPSRVIDEASAGQDVLDDDSGGFVNGVLSTVPVRCAR